MADLGGCIKLGSVNTRALDWVVVAGWLGAVGCYDADQHEVWREVANYSARRGVHSSTSSLTEMVSMDDGWIEDSFDDPDGAGPFPAINYHPSLTFWFEYEFSGHEVLPYGNIYVVETHAGDCVKLQLTDYYDEDGAKGHVSFSWSWLDP